MWIKNHFILNHTKQFMITVLVYACKFIVYITLEVPIDVKVRLTGGTAPAEGRVEVYYNNIWGTVCPFNEWDIRDAHVICKMLGYLYAVETQSSYFYGVSNSSKVRWLNNIQCNGQETSITECIHGGWFEHSCEYNQDIGVKCFGKSRFDFNVLWAL